MVEPSNRPVPRPAALGEAEAPQRKKVDRTPPTSPIQPRSEEGRAGAVGIFTGTHLILDKATAHCPVEMPPSPLGTRSWQTNVRPRASTSSLVQAEMAWL